MLNTRAGHTGHTWTHSPPPLCQVKISFVILCSVYFDFGTGVEPAASGQSYWFSCVHVHVHLCPYTLVYNQLSVHSLALWYHGLTRRTRALCQICSLRGRDGKIKAVTCPRGGGWETEGQRETERRSGLKKAPRQRVSEGIWGYLRLAVLRTKLFNTTMLLFFPPPTLKSPIFRDSTPNQALRFLVNKRYCFKFFGLSCSNSQMAPELMLLQAVTES